MVEQLLLAFALMLVIEGALYALFPDLMRKVIAAVLSGPAEQLRMSGAVSVAVGVLIVWLVKSL